MPNYLIQRLIILGGLSIIGILFIQSYWLLKTWDIKDKEFDQTVNIVLRNVAQRMSRYNNSILPKTGLIQRRSSNYYAVNINSAIDPAILEQYLIQEFNNQSLNIDFEYAVYDCFSDDLVYGNYCSTDNNTISQVKETKKLPKFDDLVYYFVVRFPSRESFLLTNMKMTLTFTSLSILTIIFFIYSMWVILTQKRLSDLQKDFINNMTHEFKTPLSSIKIAADVLAGDAQVMKNKRLQRYTQIIREQNQRLNEQVEKVLNIARLEKDSIELKKDLIELNQMLKEIVTNEAFKLPEENISFIPASQDICVMADKLHFVNVITNMIDNAIKYSHDNPEVKIILEEKDAIFVHIKDRGIGIDKESQKKLFDKFYRVSTGDVHNVKGFGLGLFYVKNICLAHGWNIQVHSEQREGTTFSIVIPKHLKI